MKITKFLLLFSLFANAPFQMANAQKVKNLFAIGSEKYYGEEFIYAYSKNNFSEVVYKDSINSYLDLYINFRLKVREAKVLGYDTTRAFKEEFKLYKKQLEESYLTPKKEEKALVEEAYERNKWEIRASHILIRMSKEASPKDTLIAYEKITSLRNRALGGENFAELAKRLSEDPSARQNGGDLGYFSVFQMVYPFEDAAYNTPVGDISAPIRTQFGYHIIKVADKRTNIGKIKVAHIMVRSTDKNAENIQEEAKKKIFKIDSLLKEGSSWDELCKLYSEDNNSKAQNGEIKPFGRGQIVPEFEKVAFALTGINDVSEPVKTQYGWHIIKLVQKMPLGTFEEEESKLARKIQSDGRSAMPRAEMMRTLKKENNFSKNDEVVEKLKQIPPSNVVDNKWNFDSAYLNNTEVLFSVGLVQVTAGEFLENAMSKPFDKRLGVKEQIVKLISAFEDSLIISYEKEKLPTKFPEYKFLVQEYYDGILLFLIMEDSVWNLSMQDSLGLKTYYEDHLSDYQKSVEEVTIFSSNDRNLLEKLNSSLPLIKNSREWETLKSNLLEENNVSPLTLQIISNDSRKGKEILNDQNHQVGDLFEEDQWYWIKRTEVFSLVPLNEIKGRVISDYQQYLDTKWIARLKKKYPVKINKKSLNKVYAHFKAIN